MNYLKIYNDLILKAQLRELQKPYEIHHIVPRCLGGNDSSTNLVKLKLREHFVAHLLLFKIYEHTSNKHKMLYALNRMLRVSTIANSRVYEKVRKLWVECHPMKNESVKKRMISNLREYNNRNGVKENLCKCGCGGVVSRSVKPPKPGSMREFLSEHRPVNYCKCGCGEMTGQKSWASDLIVFTCGCGCGGKGKVSHRYKSPTNYLHGHNPVDNSNSIKKYLTGLSDEQKEIRRKNSLGKADEVKRVQAIKLGKSSILQAVDAKGNITKFNSLDCQKEIGIDYNRIKYMIKRSANSIAEINDLKIKYIFKYGQK